MSTTATASGVDREGYDAAGLETAAAVRNAIASCVVESGLVGSLSEPRTFAEVESLIDAHPAKGVATRAALELAVVEGVLDATGDDSARSYVSSGTPFTRHRPRPELIAGWVDDQHHERVWSSQREFLGTDLGFLRHAEGWATYDTGNARAWKGNLTNPLYDLARDFAIAGVARPGGRFVDLGSGMGHGAMRLAERSDWDCHITCIEKSADFLAMTPVDELPDTVEVELLTGDMNDGLSGFADDSLDGVIICGALHYALTLERVLAELRRTVRPDGRVGISAYVVASGRPDEWVQRWMFAVNTDEVRVPTMSEFQALLADHGFAVLDGIHRGSQYSVVLGA